MTENMTKISFQIAENSLKTTWKIAEKKLSKNWEIAENKIVKLDWKLSEMDHNITKKQNGNSRCYAQRETPEPKRIHFKK